MTVGVASICFACARFRAFDQAHETAYCSAFPAGIPYELFQGADHRQPIDGDHGIRFLMRPGAQKTLAAYEKLIPPAQRSDFLERANNRERGGDWVKGDKGWFEGSTPTGAKADLMATVKATGGFTIVPGTGEQPHTGFAVAREGTSDIIRQFDPSSQESWDRMGDHLLAYIDTHDAAFEKDPNLCIGGWHDTEHGEFVLDLVDRVMERDAAISLATSRDQQGIYDLSTPAGQDGYIATGGTGGRSITGEHARPR